MKLSIFETLRVKGFVENSKEYLDEYFSLLPNLENWGYERIMLPEHHLMGSISDNPDILLPIFLERTKLNIGTAGIMLPYSQPQRIIEKFRTLNLIYPNRIDLGIVDSGQPQKNVADILSVGPDIKEKFKLIWIRKNELPQIWFIGSREHIIKRASLFGSGIIFNYVGVDILKQAKEQYCKFMDIIKTEPKIILNIGIVTPDEDNYLESLTPLSNNCLKGEINYLCDTIKKISEELKIENIMIASTIYDNNQRFELYQKIIESMRNK